MLRTLFAFLAIGSLAVSGLACGDDGSTALDENVTVTPVEATGTVGGQVLDALTDQPLDGVEVTVVTGGYAAKGSTDSSGIFSIPNVPATGVVIATFSKSGYLSADLTTTFNGAAGDYPLTNATATFGPLALVPSDGDFTVYVFDQNGRPAQGHLLTLTTRVRFLTYVNGASTGNGTFTTTAQVGSTGIATFFNIPDYWALGEKVDSRVDISVPPYDAEDDGFFEFAGETYTFDLLDLDNPQPTILMSDTHNEYPTTLGIEASNVQQLETNTTNGYAPSSLPGVGPITVLFNQPIAEDSLLVSVYDEDGTTPFAPQTQLNGRSLTITFPTALPTGAEYNLNITATALTGDQLVTGSFSASFFVIDESASVTASVDFQDSSDPANLFRIVTFSEPVGFGLPGVALAGGNCVIYYDIWNLGPGSGTGDDPGEYGASSCPYSLAPDEPVPAMPAGAIQSGYTKTWIFQVPLMTCGTPPCAPVPQATPVHLIFGSVDSTSRIMRRVNGEPLDSIEVALP